MARRINRALIQFPIFCGLLLFILFLNRPQRLTDKSFSWNIIRYKTTAHSLPDNRGVCPRLATNKKPALVVARVASDGDPKWTDALTDKYHLCVYTVDAPIDKTSNYLQVPANRGHEAMAYLTFIIDNYDHIPEAGVVFVHGSRWAWHNDQPTYDNAALLAALDISSALSSWGYHNLRCDWSVQISPWDARAVSDNALPSALVSIFGGNEAASKKDSSSNAMLGRQDILRSQCCAQFVVSKENILQHSRDEYVALRQWLLDSRDISKTAAPRDDRVAGRIISYVWHILFIAHEEDTNGVSLERLNRVACPHADECYCRLYGRCDLEHCTAGSCRGQYRIPPDFRLPDDWAVTHP
ncbi:hypothetical protein BGW36DRAFT_285956 [Talaromyces proteolyticus]|uniref:Uncharacterized protein n=1 Tax=Talaromyces proteolyticus TaxID=1131652 RepID=A0AAD4L2G7_9EURO|nr:uncharacterized protein BGW36DRAFT_285956 [Talaromyces proteolyticus]KAH8705989.1 hypothetical protein BGW36DRAFT_285956 [Talaromyces proteolyticus]